jgi:hypothetical protein
VPVYFVSQVNLRLCNYPPIYCIIHGRHLRVPVIWFDMYEYKMRDVLKNMKAYAQGIFSMSSAFQLVKINK